MFKISTLYILEHKIEKVDLEVSFSRGLPGVYIVGLPGKVVEESITRIKESILNMGLEYPEFKIIINLSPANIIKKSSLFDFPITFIILINNLVENYRKKFKNGSIFKDNGKKSNSISNFANLDLIFNLFNKIILNVFNQFLILGEIGLDGVIKKNSNLFSFCLNAKKYGFKYLIFPEDNYDDFESIVKNDNLFLFPFGNIKDAYVFFESIFKYTIKIFESKFYKFVIDKWNDENFCNENFIREKIIELIKEINKFIDKKIEKKIDNNIKNDIENDIENKIRNNKNNKISCNVRGELKNNTIEKNRNSTYNSLFISDNNKIFRNKFENYIGGYNLKQGLLIAAAGFHNVLIKGPSGVGKTFLSKCLIEILPPLTYEEKIELTNLYAMFNMLKKNKLIDSRPVRTPHHTMSMSSMVGGGTILVPGEVTLAHRGVLILDEVNLFKRDVIESLREAISEKCVVISKHKNKIVLPAMFLNVMIQNLCPCGNLGSRKRTCYCTPHEILMFNKKLSNTIIDRFDIILNVEDIDFEFVSSKDKVEEENNGNIKEKGIKTYNINYNDNINNNKVIDIQKMHLYKKKDGNVNNTKYCVKEEHFEKINKKYVTSDIKVYTTKNMYEIVKQVQNIQIKRYNSNLDYFNGKVNKEIFYKNVFLSDELESYLKLQTRNMQISFRKIEKIIRVARTIADIEGNVDITKENIDEAIYFVKDYKIKLTLS